MYLSLLALVIGLAIDMTIITSMMIHGASPATAPMIGPIFLSITLLSSYRSA